MSRSTKTKKKALFKSSVNQIPPPPLPLKILLICPPPNLGLPLLLPLNLATFSSFLPFILFAWTTYVALLLPRQSTHTTAVYPPSSTRAPTPPASSTHSWEYFHGRNPGNVG